jgi:hypothetical protein
MSDETRIEDDVEAHRHGHGNAANDQDDFEAHRHGHGNAANDEGKSEDEGDDFELHHRRNT